MTFAYFLRLSIWLSCSGLVPGKAASRLGLAEGSLGHAKPSWVIFRPFKVFSMMTRCAVDFSRSFSAPEFGPEDGPDHCHCGRF